MRHGIATVALALMALAHTTAAMELMMEATTEGTMDGMMEGTMDGMMEGTLEGTMDGMMEGTMEGTVDGMMEECVPGCMCTQTDLVREFSCQEQILRVRDIPLAEIYCQGRTMDCSLIPSVDVGRGGTLNRLELRACSLSSSLSCALRALNATGASEITFREMGTPLTPRAMEGVDAGTLQKLMISDTSAQTSIPADVLSSLTNLTEFRFSSFSPLSLSADMFSTVPTLEYIELSLAQFESVPADTFRGLSRLHTLVTYKNNIKDIHVDAFRGLDSLRTLTIEFNPLSALPRGLFARTPNLKELSLKRNFLKSLDEGVVSGLRHLEELNIENDEPLILGGRALSDLPALQRLSVTSADVPALPADLLLHTTAIVNLTLQDNKIASLPAGVFSSLKRLQRLVLTGNRLSGDSTRSLEPLVAAKEILLDHNHLEEIPPRVFARMGSLQLLSLAHNRVWRVSEHAFSGEVSASLRELNLRDNRLAWHEDIDPVFGIDASSPLNPLNNLETLDLSHNHLRTIPSDLTLVMGSLRTLDLSHNNLTQINKTHLNFRSPNVVVDLRDNGISTIEPNPDTTTSPTSPTFLLDRNPYNCDCLLYPFLKERALRPARYDVGAATCARPAALHSRPLPAVAVGDVTCPLPAPETPPSCACLYRPAVPRAECACARVVYATLPDITLISSDPRMYMALALTAPQSLDDLPPFVKHLNVSGVGLRSVPKLPHSLNLVDLSDNRLSTIPLDVLARSNLTLLLKGNRFECSCDTKNEVAKIINHPMIRDREELRCADGGLLIRVNPGSLCDVYLAALIGGVLAGLGVFVAVLAAISYRYATEIRVYLYRFGLKWIVSEESLDADKKYDIFLSYADKDFEFVSKVLLPKLEAKYSVCVHYRDWDVGRLVHDNIYLSVYESRRTVIVFTNNFLESEYATMEFRAAYQQGLKDGRVRAVLVVADEIDEDDIHPEIKSFMSLTTYIKWGDSLFWNRLEMALPKKLKAKELRAQKRAKMAVDTLAPMVAGSKGPNVDKLAPAGGLNVIVNDEGKLVNRGFEYSN